MPAATSCRIPDSMNSAPKEGPLQTPAVPPTHHPMVIDTRITAVVSGICIFLALPILGHQGGNRLPDDLFRLDRKRGSVTEVACDDDPAEFLACDDVARGDKHRSAARRELFLRPHLGEVDLSTSCAPPRGGTDPAKPQSGDDPPGSRIYRHPGGTRRGSCRAVLSRRLTPRHKQILQRRLRPAAEYCDGAPILMARCAIIAPARDVGPRCSAARLVRGASPGAPDRRAAPFARSFTRAADPAPRSDGWRRARLVFTRAGSGRSPGLSLEACETGGRDVAARRVGAARNTPTNRHVQKPRARTTRSGVAVRGCPMVLGVMNCPPARRAR
jgi:hypothetical protein